MAYKKSSKGKSSKAVASKTGRGGKGASKPRSGSRKRGGKG